MIMLSTTPGMELGTFHGTPGPFGYAGGIASPQFFIACKTVVPALLAFIMFEKSVVSLAVVQGLPAARRRYP